MMPSKAGASSRFAQTSSSNGLKTVIARQVCAARKIRLAHQAFASTPPVIGCATPVVSGKVMGRLRVERTAM
jgi:hypothetical protein